MSLFDSLAMDGRIPGPEYLVFGPVLGTWSLELVERQDIVPADG
jgi:hypothetical protein